MKINEFIFLFTGDDSRKKVSIIYRESPTQKKKTIELFFQINFFNVFRICPLVGEFKPLSKK